MSDYREFTYAPTPTPNHDTDWRNRAGCSGTDLDAWFPSVGENPHRAKKICRGCPVQLACLRFALDNEIGHGIFGGATPDDRRKMIKERREAAA